VDRGERDALVEDVVQHQHRAAAHVVARGEAPGDLAPWMSLL
jgi:hypothetical protein